MRLLGSKAKNASSGSPRGSSTTTTSPTNKKWKTTTYVICILACVSLVLVWCVVFVTYELQHNHTTSYLSLPIAKEALWTDVQGQKMLLKLESAQRRVQELEAQIVEYQRQQKRDNNDPPLQQRLTKRDHTSELKQVEDDVQQCQPQPQQQQPFVHRNPICQALPHPIPTPAFLWTSHLSQIHAASQLPNDHKFYFHDFTAQLLHLVSPRLEASIKTTLRDIYWPQLDRILQVAHKRYDYIQHPDSYTGRDIPRPVKIVILGGSLLVGMNCRKIIRDLGFQLRLPIGECSWANRLEKLLNQFALGGKLQKALQREDSTTIFQVTKIAMGGTNTQTASKILEFDLIPPEAKNPDIVINAYATNDLHVLTLLEAQSGNATLRDKVFDMIQEFVRRVFATDNPCQSPPLLLHVDDYLGNEQREILATTELSQGVQVLANYYGFASASYADVVRDWVYGDTQEYWFSPEGWYETAGSPVMSREIHPNMGMHIVAAWVVAYNMLHWVTTFCSLEGWNLHASSLSKKNNRRMHYNNTLLSNLPVLNGKRWPKGKPKPPPAQLPPLLTKELSLEDISNKWATSAGTNNINIQQDCNSNTAMVKCPFSWLSGISSVLEKPKSVEAFFQQHTQQLQLGDWKFLDDHGKLGIVPSALGNVMTLQLELTQTIHKITIFFMKSYGPKWEGSTMRVQGFAATTGQLLASKTMTGFHDKHTSETYTEHLDVSLEAGSTFKLQMELVGGTTFKVMGIAICS